MGVIKGFLVNGEPQKYDYDSLANGLNRTQLLVFLNDMLKMFEKVAYTDSTVASQYQLLKNSFKSIKFNNLVPKAVDNRGNIFDNIGYRNGYYMSGGNVASTADANCTITGYIPIGSVDNDGIGDKYRIMGVGEPASSHTRIAFGTSEFGCKGEANSFLSGSVTSGAMGVFDLTTETVDNQTVYVLTVNKKISAYFSDVAYLRFSFDGTDGDDLVITYNEEIY